MTEQEKQDLKQDILNSIKSESQSVTELQEVTSLDGVKSLPAMRGTELVTAPISLLGKPATDAAAQAAAAKTVAETAANIANEAASNANNKAGIAVEAAQKANTAASNAGAVVETAKVVIGKYENVAVLALGGATARFHGLSDLVEIEASEYKTDTQGIPVYYDFSRHIFYVEDKGSCYRNFPEAGLYSDENFSPLKNKLYLYGETIYVWSDEENNLVEASGTGGGNTVNVTEEYPLGSGYYTLETAIKAVEEKRRGKGRCITYEVSQGKWETKQFIGTSLTSWESASSWEDFGGGGTMKSLTVNGEKKTPDAEGNVSLTIDKVEVDESLNAESTNPVENRALATKFSEIDASTIFDSSAELSDDESTIHVSLMNKSGAEVTGFDIPAGGGGGGDASTTKIVLSASVDHSTVKEGDSVKLTYTYDHQNASGDEKGESTGQKAKITIQVRRGATTTYNETTQDVSRGTYTFDLTKYLLVGTSDIYVIAETIDPTTGKTQKKQAYVSVQSVTLTLSSSYNLSSGLSTGGYGTQETVSIPYAVNGTGTKVVTLYVDGVQKEAHTVTRSGTTNSSFSLAMSGLSVGRHTVQMVAEMEAENGLTLRSESIFIDLLKSGNSAPFVGLMITHKDGRIFNQNNHLTPTIEVGQYESCEFKFAAYDPSTTPASVEICRNGALLQTVSVPRTVQTYQNRFTEQGRQTMQFRVGTTTYTFYIDVSESGIDISETTYGLQLKLSPAGRSNGESNPAQWESNGIRTTFEGFDWSSNGWTGDSLLLTNGAKAVIGYELFREDAGATGMTIEAEFKVSNVTERNAEIISCMADGKGLSVTTEEASIKTGTILHYENEDGEDASREIKIGTKFAPDQWLKVAFVIGRRSDGRLMELYVNGNRAGADIYDNSYYFQQDKPVGITIDSAAVDVEVKNIRIYNRALSDDELLENRIVDADSTEDMMRLWEENDIMSDTNDVDIDKLRAKGKGVMRIVRKGGLDEVNETNNKSTDFSADVYFWSPFGSAYDFVLRDCYIRIQGTSSTKYPSKNIRIYMSKGGADLSLTVGGAEVAGKTYTMRPGNIAMNLFCMKSDYSDSSMSMNTGVAKLYNDVMLEMGLLTPPQRYQYDKAGGSLNAVNIRQSIDGFPIDVFSAETADGESTYYGQYNFNNEKSKSGKLFGLEGLDGYTPQCPLTLETLNNGEKVCLFQSESDADLASNFDAGLETNWPDDVKWAGLSAAQQTALKRLFAWIRSCVPSGAMANNISSFASAKFKSEVSQYFDMKHLLTYYIHTDYFASVDQRAKNILLRTWDGLIWYTTYYDGDTQLGKRNDCFLAYDYTLDRDTWDAEAGKYAFEGRESWLWNLVLANLQDELNTCAAEYRSKMTVERVLTMLDGEQAGNWSDRAFNKSGYLKYIRPNMEEVYGKKWPFIYALQGSNAAHRSYFVRNRFALLDAKYGTSNFTSDNIDLYMARTAQDSADVVKITANEVYAFGYGTNNSPNIANTGIVEGGKTATLQITGAYTVNDPLRIYGASRMRVLDMTGAANHLKNGLDLGKCTVLRELNLQSGGNGSTGWWLNIGSCRQLRKVNLRYQAQAKTGSNTSTELDFTNQTKLETLDARGTQVQSVTFAKGAPLTSAQLPGTLTVLKLEYLSKLTTNGLTLESYSNVKTLIVDSCPGLNWETLLSRCSNVERLRVTGIDKEDDGTWLNRFVKMGGVDAEGNATNTCALVGTVQLTSYMEDEAYEALKAHFPELNILQPEYSMIEFDDTVSDDANVSNLDNKTGYKYGKDYVPSGHVLAILKKRYRCLAKVTKKPTTRNITHAGVQTIANNLDGTYPLHNDDSNYYADAGDIKNCSPAKLDGTEGDWMMYEPHRWYKGVNDYLNGKHYCCWSSNQLMPKTPEATIITLDEIKESGDYRDNYKVMGGKDTLANSYTADNNYAVCRVGVSGYKRVRFPSVPGTNLMGAVFTDSAGKVLDSVVVSTLNARFVAGMYLISDVPSNAVSLNFTIQKTAEFDKVVLSNSDKIEDMEPEWAEEDEHLCGVVGSSVVGSKLRACITGGSTTASMTWTDFHYYSVQRGMQQIDGLMHNNIGNLFFAKYGRRDSQMQCGAGQHTNNRTTGGTAKIGMQDTVNTDGVTVGGVDGNGLAFYKETNSNGETVFTRINNINCLGYEDIYGHKYDMMDGVDMPNSSGNTYKWRFTYPDGTERMVLGISTNDIWITGMSHGKYMDLVPVAGGGSQTTYYCDKYYVSGSAGRVVYRGDNFAYVNGGVSYANANYDASYSGAHVGSRLAFRGKIVVAQSVAAYKSAVEVA